MMKEPRKKRKRNYDERKTTPKEGQEDAFEKEGSTTTLEVKQIRKSRGKIVGQSRL